jgi:hypothetical protein
MLGGLQPLVAEGGRHPQVEQDHVGGLAVDQPQERWVSVAWPVTSMPRAARVWAKPSRSSAESSASIRRMAGRPG